MIDGLLLYHLKDELNSQLVKGRLERIIQHDAFTFGFTFYRYGEKHQLMINLHPSQFAIYLTQNKSTQQTTTQFFQSLKKELTGAILSSIDQYQTDRVLILRLMSYDLIEGPIEKQLVFEAMGKYSNLILTSNDMIIDTYKKMFFDTGRQLLPHASFSYFPSDKKPFTSFSFDGMDSPKTITSTYMGLSRLTATYLFDHQIKPLDLNVKPTIDHTTNERYFSDIFDQDDMKIHLNNISELFDTPMRTQKQSKLSYEQFIDKQLKKYERKQEQLLEQQQSNQMKLQMKSFGDAIYQSLLSLSEKHASITVDHQIISLDPTLTLNENAQRFYQIYQKAKRGIEPIENQLSSNQQLIDLFNEYKIYLSMSDNEDLMDFESDLLPYGYKVKKKSHHPKKSHQPNILMIKDDDATYLIGKNDAQNTYITHQLARANDTWFHVKDAPGSHVVVQSEQLNEAIIRKAAMLAAYHSSLSLSSSIPVDYTQIRHLKKIPKMPGYHVTYTHQKTIFIDIDQAKINAWLNL